EGRRARADQITASWRIAKYLHGPHSSARTAHWGPGPRDGEPARSRRGRSAFRNGIARRVLDEPGCDAWHFLFEITGCRDVEHAGARLRAVLEVVSDADRKSVV